MELKEIFTADNAKDNNRAIAGQKIEMYLGGNIPATENIEDLYRLLSDNEVERVSKFVFENDRTMYILTHACLKKVLSLKTGLAPASIHYSYSEFEKPYLQNERVQFNLSHSKVFFAIALSDHLPVGIDTENFCREIDWKPVSRLYFTTKEIAWVKSHDLEEEVKAFFTLWTRKEALLKAIGCGITNELASVDVRSLHFTEGKAIIPAAGDQWYIRSYSFGENIISLALPEDFFVEIHGELG